MFTTVGHYLTVKKWCYILTCILSNFKNTLGMAEIHCLTLRRANLKDV